ncbi:Uncharacterized conserved protein [Phaffia rhodozyma]|uniref:Uncharacterized conserved protein n=1 Tax=Phaffia rhodozyma TaxID=264483 RepID=A0A0F7SS30_PHARH|nr:Uncharacterized conserved protein [Phaffia rhodozyma]
MPVPAPSPPQVVPTLTRSKLRHFRFSEWYPVFRRVSIRGTVFKFSPEEQVTFTKWFDEDGMRLPDGVLLEDLESHDDDADDDDDDDDDDVADDDSSSSSSSTPPVYSLPRLTSHIASTFTTFKPSGVFPKLNSVCPQDAQWILPFPLPMKCPSIEDLFMVLKASGLMNGVMEALNQTRTDGEEAVDGVIEDETEDQGQGELLEMVLKKWYDLDRSREFRMFIRDNTLLGICQRDTNFYEHLVDPDTQAKIHQSLLEFFDTTIRGKFAGGPDYVVDVYMTSNLSSAHIVDFSPYHPFHTSPLLFSYEQLHELYLSTLSSPSCTGSESSSLSRDSHPIDALSALSLSDLPASQTTPDDDDEEEQDVEVITSLPLLLMIPSRAHPMAARNAPAWPAYPVDVNCIGGGRDIEEFKKVWEEEVREAARN